jgi:hypothetical protein
LGRRRERNRKLFLALWRLCMEKRLALCHNTGTRQRLYRDGVQLNVGKDFSIISYPKSGSGCQASHSHRVLEGILDLG